MLSFIWNNFLFHPVLNALISLYYLFGENLGWAVIVLAIVVRLLLIRSTKKQMTMTKTMATLKPKLEKLNKKYANNKELLAKEQIKLYKETGYNPLGCLFNFLPQMIILIVIIQVIRVVTIDNNFDGLYPFVETWVNVGKDFTLDTRFFFWDLGKNYSEIVGEKGYFSGQGIAYLSLSLSVGVIQFISSKFMQAMQAMDKPEKKKKGKKKDEQMAPEEMQKQMMKSMITIFPLLTIYITLTVPSVLGVYWLAQSAMLVVQYYFIDKKKTLETFQSLNPLNKSK